jgi:glycosyltransferase involved in cell wall biosynthesis
LWLQRTTHRFAVRRSERAITRKIIDMLASPPDVSVIIAAHDAAAFIATAVESALVQQPATVEVIVAPDDSNDYGFLCAMDPRIRVLDPLPPGSKPTGPAATRNRALAAARGQFIALLDADDYWSPNYLQRLLPLARSQGLAFGRTAIADWNGTECRLIPRQPAVDRIDYSHFTDAFGSLHAVVRRDANRAWHDILAEDVLFDVESLALAGGSAPYAADAVYWLQIRPQSVTHGADFIANIDAGYEAIIGRISSGATLIPATEAPAAIAVFRAWQEMNARFSRDQVQNPALEFHTYVAALAVPSLRR